MVLVVKNPPANAGDPRDTGLIPGSGRCPEEGNGNPLQYLPGESYGQKSLAGYSLRGHKESDTTERLSTFIITKLATLEVTVQDVDTRGSQIQLLPQAH